VAKHGFYRTSEWKALRDAALKRDRNQCQAPGCQRRATHVDHIQTRPAVGHLTPADVLTNLRSLCATHDGQVKEMASGRRAQGGKFVIRGVDAHGWPTKPRRCIALTSTTQPNWPAP